MTKLLIRNEPIFLHMSWCLKNDIKVYVLPINRIECRLVVEDKGVKYVDQNIFRLNNTVPRRRRKKGEPKPIPYSDRIYELYTIKYLEYNGKKEKSI